MRNIICIYPEDRTTDFLLPIYEQLELFDDFIGFRFNSLVSCETKKIYDPKYFNKDSILFFLGHGASDKLYGSINQDGDKQVLFNKNNIDHIKKLDFVCISCRSKEFANKQFHKYIGFGNITSDFSEVITERNCGDSNYLEWATPDDIIIFQKLFVQSITEAIILSKCKDILSIYKMLRFCFNRKIANTLRDRSLSNYRQLADMLFEISNEIEIGLNNVL